MGHKVKQFRETGMGVGGEEVNQSDNIISNKLFSVSSMLVQDQQ